MDRKEIILSKIADILSKRNFMYESNSDMKARLKCIGLLSNGSSGFFDVIVLCQIGFFILEATKPPLYSLAQFSFTI